MKSVSRLFILAVLVFLLSASAAYATSVTFQVNMTVQIALGNFNPGTDTVVVRGNFNGWAGNQHFLVDNGTGVYTGTFDVPVGELQYKFVIAPDGWESVDNRIAQIGTDPVVLPVVFFNNVETASTANVEVRFRVNMQVQQLTGNFDPATDWVVVRGSHANIGNWGGATRLTEETTNPGIYSAWVVFDSLPVGAALQYKFVILNNGDVNDASWESNDNRTVTPTGTEPDVIPPPSGNGYGEIMPEVVYFSNIGPDDIITQDLNVVFQVDVRPLFGRLRDQGFIVDVQTGDTVRAPLESINAAGFFNNWPWGNFAPEHNLNDAGQNGDQIANDSVWSRSILFPAGSPRNLIYKYGANQLDVEAGFAMNHEIMLDDQAATFFIPTVCWGSQDTLYQQWQVECMASAEPIPGRPTPGAYALAQNYPNPFNPSTTIEFAIPRQDVLTLRVFDLLGREVVTLDLGRVEAGAHRVQFDGSSLSSGVYFYRLESPHFNATRKMLLMK